MQVETESELVAYYTLYLQVYTKYARHVEDADDNVFHPRTKA